MITPQEFIYWLQGALEISETKSLNEAQTATIRAKLEDCFVKKTEIPPQIQGQPIKYCHSKAEEKPFKYCPTFDSFGVKIDTGIWDSSWAFKTTNQPWNGKGHPPTGFLYDNRSLSGEGSFWPEPANLLNPPTFYTC